MRVGAEENSFLAQATAGTGKGPSGSGRAARVAGRQIELAPAKRFSRRRWPARRRATLKSAGPVLKPSRSARPAGRPGWRARAKGRPWQLAGVFTRSREKVNPSSARPLARQPDAELKRLSRAHLAPLDAARRFHLFPLDHRLGREKPIAVTSRRECARFSGVHSVRPVASNQSEPANLVEGARRWLANSLIYLQQIPSIY